MWMEFAESLTIIMWYGEMHAQANPVPQCVGATSPQMWHKPLTHHLCRDLSFLHVEMQLCVPTCRGLRWQGKLSSQINILIFIHAYTHPSNQGLVLLTGLVVSTVAPQQHAEWDYYGLLTIAVIVRYLAVCVCMFSLWLTGDLSGVYPASHLMSAGIGTNDKLYR